MAAAAAAAASSASAAKIEIERAEVNIEANTIVDGLRKTTMTHAAPASKTTEKTSGGKKQASSPSKNGVSMAPPAHGIGLADHGIGFFGNAVVQARGGISLDAPQVHSIAEEGLRGPSKPLPFMDEIQSCFGAYSIRDVQAHDDAHAANANSSMGSLAYATRNHVAFGIAPTLFTVAHEAAHIIQQRAGIHLRTGVGAPGDIYEQNANEVATAVVRGESAQPLLAAYAGTPMSDSLTSGVVQHLTVFRKPPVKIYSEKERLPTNKNGSVVINQVVGGKISTDISETGETKSIVYTDWDKAVDKTLELWDTIGTLRRQANDEFRSDASVEEDRKPGERGGTDWWWLLDFALSVALGAFTFGAASILSKFMTKGIRAVATSLQGSPANEATNTSIKNAAEYFTEMVTKPGLSEGSERIKNAVKDARKPASDQISSFKELREKFIGRENTRITFYMWGRREEVRTYLAQELKNKNTMSGADKWKCLQAIISSLDSLEMMESIKLAQKSAMIQAWSVMLTDEYYNRHDHHWDPYETSTPETTRNAARASERSMASGQLVFWVNTATPEDKDLRNKITGCYIKGDGMTSAVANRICEYLLQTNIKIGDLKMYIGLHQPKIEVNKAEKYYGGLAFWTYRTIKARVTVVWSPDASESNPGRVSWLALGLDGGGLQGNESGDRIMDGTDIPRRNDSQVNTGIHWLGWWGDTFDANDGIKVLRRKLLGSTLKELRVDRIVSSPES